MRTRTVLRQSLVIYVVLSGILSFCQSDYVGADFVAYVTIARRMIAQPSQAITAYWSPLFSWMMIPPLLLGVDDLIAGRLVLLTSGFVYLCAIHRLTETICGSTSNTDRLIKIGTMTCSTIQASIWATYLLDPDLLANAILYLYFCLIFENETHPHRPISTFLGGAVAGVCYLSKAYMLPFCLVHFVLTMGIRWLLSGKSQASWSFVRHALQSICLFGLGLGIVAGPWIACLTRSQGRPTFSTAGSSNHANVGPETFKKDPLWNPGLVPDYIFEPSLKPDWSPFQDAKHFLHQIQLILHNGGNCVGLIPAWTGMFLLSLCAIRYWRIHLMGPERSFLVWATLTVLIYCAGYTTVNLEARYIVPTVAPLLCLASLILIRATLVARMAIVTNHHSVGSNQPASNESGKWNATSGEIPYLSGDWPAVGVIVVVLAFAGCDLYNLVRIATVHPQSVKRAKFRAVVEELRKLQIPEGPMACTDWHFGLYVAYASNHLSDYWGAPLVESANSITDDLDSKKIKTFLRLVPDSTNAQDSRAGTMFDEQSLWIRTSTIHHQELHPLAVEVYVRH